MHSQVRDDFEIPVESKKGHGDDHRQDAQMVNIRSHTRQCQLPDLGNGMCERGRVERCVSLEKSGCTFSESGSRAAAVASERPRRPRSAPSNELQVPRLGLERTQKPAGNEGLDSALGDEMGDAGASGPEMPAATLAASMAERIASLPPEALRALQAMLDALT